MSISSKVPRKPLRPMAKPSGMPPASSTNSRPRIRMAMIDGGMEGGSLVLERALGRLRRRYFWMEGTIDRIDRMQDQSGDQEEAANGDHVGDRPQRKIQDRRRVAFRRDEGRLQPQPPHHDQDEAERQDVGDETEPDARTLRQPERHHIDHDVPALMG